MSPIADAVAALQAGQRAICLDRYILYKDEPYFVLDTHTLFLQSALLSAKGLWFRFTPLFMSVWFKW